MEKRLSPSFGLKCYLCAKTVALLLALLACCRCAFVGPEPGRVVFLERIKLSVVSVVLPFRSEELLLPILIVENNFPPTCFLIWESLLLSSFPSYRRDVVGALVLRVVVDHLLQRLGGNLFVDLRLHRLDGLDDLLSCLGRVRNSFLNRCNLGVLISL